QGVIVRGLGTFAVVHEKLHNKEKVHMIRRPIFRLDIDEPSLQDFTLPTGVIPGNVKIKPMNFHWLSRATSFSRQVVEDCVQETIVLYSLQLRNKQHFAFTFKDIGVLSCQNNVLCMRFYHKCITGLESKACWDALLHT
ncbi:CCD81 protein, partial [Trogon melanurus]|nr:CCD81 protein [Trogon melanurus]